MSKKTKIDYDYDYESIDEGIKDKIIKKIKAEIKKDNSKFFEEQPPITIKEKNWKKDAKGKDIPFADGVKTIIKEICDAKREEGENGEKIIKLSRSEVFGESDTKKKIIKVLMWGYPRAKINKSRQYIINITNAIETLAELFGNLAGRGINEIWQIMNDVSGLGIATMSKLLYFFEVSFDGKRCLIYDSDVIEFLNHDENKLTLRNDCYGEYLILNDDFKKKLGESGLSVRKSPWEPTDDCYFKYLGLMDKLKNDLNIDDPAKIELYMYEGGKKLADDKKKELKKNANLKDNS